MRYRISGAMRQFIRSTVVIACLGAPFLATSSQAQQLNLQSGLAPKIDVVARAQGLNMQDPYARSLYQFIRANPTVMENAQFYVGFLAYLLSTSPNFECSNAFANEFERRDYFTQAFGLKEQLKAAVGSVTIPTRFDLAYTIDTGRYDFTASSLPLQNIRTVGNNFSNQISAGQAQSCAQQMLQGTTVDISVFPWNFQVVNEAGAARREDFPFGRTVQMPSTDARVLFERFGRQLYAIVSYQFQAANNGEAKVQVVPTDGQLFGLADDAVVRVKSFSHPSLSQAQYFDITNPLEVGVDVIGVDAKLAFTQQGFRAVGEGTRQDAGTDITLGGSFPVNGSAAVGNSTFIMRLAGPQLVSRQVPGLRNQANTVQPQRFLTLFGSVNFSQITQNVAPVSGVALVLDVAADGTMTESQAFPLYGEFRPPQPEAAPAGAAAPQPAETANSAPAPAVAPSDAAEGSETQ